MSRVCAALRLRQAAAAALAVALVLALAGCAARLPQRPVAESELMQQQREQRLAAVDQWSLRGRVAVKNGEEGGSGTVSWDHVGANTEFELRAPISGQSWRLRLEPGAALLQGLEGGDRSGGDAETLIREAVGWELPLQDLGFWVRGARAPGQAHIAFGADGLPSEIRQRGWRIEYLDWVAVGAQTLPRKLYASRDQHSLRLIIARWELAP